MFRTDRNSFPIPVDADGRRDGPALPFRRLDVADLPVHTEATLATVVNDRWRSRLWILAVVLSFRVAACVPADSPTDNASSWLDDLATSRTEERVSADDVDPPPQVLTSAELGLPSELSEFQQPWSGDLDALVERRVIRLLTVFSRGFYFLDGPDQRGITYEAAQRFEALVNERFSTGTLKVNVVVLPVSREQLFPALAAGYGDIAAANLTVTPERAELVDFSDALYPEVAEIVVTGPGAPPLDSVGDLGGQTIHVRRSSSYFDSLTAFNERQRSTGAAVVNLVEAPDHLEDDDLMEMVNAGLLPMVIVDSHKAEFWAQIFDNIVPRPDLALRTGGQIAWALRKDTPMLRELVNEFVRDNRRGTLLGNMALNRYLRDTGWVENSYVGADLGRFRDMVVLFRQYGDQYDFDWLMLAAQGFQESRLDQSLRSRVGAVGVMQLLPSTAADGNVGVVDIDVLENNIHAGAKYLRFLRDRYFDDPALDPFNASLLSFAAYNAGPRRVAQLRSEAAEAGLDPNVWFQHVERIAAKRIGRETVQYVSNIFKYYIAYRLLQEQRAVAQ